MWADLPSEIRWQILNVGRAERHSAARTIQRSWRGSVVRLVHRLAHLAFQLLTPPQESICGIDWRVGGRVGGRVGERVGGQ